MPRLGWRERLQKWAREVSPKGEGSAGVVRLGLVRDMGAGSDAKGKFSIWVGEAKGAWTGSGSVSGLPVYRCSCLFEAVCADLQSKDFTIVIGDTNR